MRLDASAPEDAEFYVVIRGSTLTHVTTAKRGLDGLTLRFTAPGTLTPDGVRILSFPLVLPLFSHLDLLGPPPQAMFSAKSPPSRPTVTRRSGSRPAAGKRLWSTAGMLLPGRSPSARVQPGSSSAPGAPRRQSRDFPRGKQEGSTAPAGWTCSPVQVLKLVSGLWVRRSQMPWPTWITLSSGKTPTVFQERKVMKQEVRV